jgi:NodT family efflux transporter outer membrane factor (OMF) lipoprotein
MACVIILLALSGCRIPGLQSADPGRPLPPDFRGLATPQSSAQTGIVEFFDDNVLLPLLVQGLAQNQELKIRNQQIQIARNEIMARRGFYLPFITGGGLAGFDKPSLYTPIGAAENQLTFPGGGRFPDPEGNFRLTTDLFWRIDIWRQYRNARDSAIQRFNAAVEDRNFLITKLVADTAVNYYELASLDKRLEYLNQTIELQQQSLDVARELKDKALGTELGVQRFLGEVRKNESQRYIIRQRIVEVENQINYLVGRFPQDVDREAWDFINLDSRVLNVGMPSALLLNRRDIQAAEREITASGLDVAVARADFFPKVDIVAGVGYEAFDPRFLFNPGAMIANAAGELTAPLINRMGIRAAYLTANARQLQAVYDYQRTVINAFTEVVNAMTKVRNYRNSARIKLEQVEALRKSVDVARFLYNKPIKEDYANVAYIDILLATRDLLDARTVLIETKQQQLSAMVNAYQALGGGYLLTNTGPEMADVLCSPEDMPLDMFLNRDTREVIPTPEPNGIKPEADPAAAEELPPPAAPKEEE